MKGLLQRPNSQHISPALQQSMSQRHWEHDPVQSALVLLPAARHNVEHVLAKANKNQEDAGEVQ